MHLYSSQTKALPFPTLFISVVFSFVFLLFLFFSSTAHSQQSIEWISYPDEKGFAYIEYTGQESISPYVLIDTLTTQGCDVRVLWDPVKRIGYHSEAVGVADFVNESFLNSTIQNQTKITLQCKEPHNVQQYSIIEDIKNTYIHWFSYPETNTQRNKQGDATIQYGGGSFYQLVSRLSIEGCNVHTLSIQNKHYSFQNTNQENKEFTDNYKDAIPQDTIIDISCIDNCDVIYGLDLVTDPGIRTYIQNVEKCRDDFQGFFTEIYGTNLDSYTECMDNWSDGARQFFSVVPVFQNACKVEVFLKEGDGSAFFGGSMAFGGSISSPGRALYQSSVTSTIISLDKNPLQRQTDRDLLLTELHELCHVHQHWYTYKEYVDYDYLKGSLDRGPTSLWHKTPMANDFNDIIGFEQDSNGAWYIENHSSVFNRDFSEYYNTNPLELSAQLCAVYLLEKIQPNNEYSRYSKPPYITPAIEQWIEKYIVLPA